MEFCLPRDLFRVMRGFTGADAGLLPGVAAGRGTLPGVADASRAGPAGVLPEPLSFIPNFLAGCPEPPAALAGVTLAARAAFEAAAAGRGVAKPPAAPPAPPTAGGAVLGALAGVAAAAGGAGVAGVAAADAGGLLL